MKRIGLLSDTHGHIDPRYEKYFESCDEIWHCGDIGSIEVYDFLSSIKPVRAVYGNIDGQPLRTILKKSLRFRIDEVEVVMTHIGGSPGRYDREIVQSLMLNPPTLFVCGHSHILKVMFDKTLRMLYINPGAAGISGFHPKRTLIRFSIEKDKIEDLEVIELGER